ncbi:E3 SUMO-protein ligase pli1 isoform 1 [Schistosoma japonicum]|uniref:E3 SUMO-protein ligase pli1 isoform 1 n=1 Tax=Schistosoma japonicum TaxID=6182 RepID=A0A4Z2CNF8_SCHJA|nr:E3 SUMO-protein ligase pli1 isoform 1 [Schistosoma japonicum]
MSAPNLPNGTLRPGLPFELCRSDYSLPVPVISQASSLVSAPRNVYNTYPSNSQSRGVNVLQKSTVSTSTSSFSLVGTSNIVQSNANSFANYPAFNTIFQTLLRGTNSQVSIPPANVTGYVNTVAGPNGNLFTGFRPTQLSYQPNVRITAPANVSSVSNHGTMNSVALKSTTCNARNNITSTPACVATSATTTCSSPAASRTSVESLFVPNNLIPVPDSTNEIRKLGAITFLRWAAACTRAFGNERISVWPRSKADSDALHEMNFCIAPPGLLGIYSESPFLRPVVLLRRVQFAAPGNVNPNIPDTDNMVRALREMADAKVTKYQGFAPHFPPSAASVGFTTDYMTYVFTLELERQVVKLLQRPKNGGHSEWRIVLRLGWATTDFYVPCNPSTKTPSRRALILESLPRCLSVRVGGRPVLLPDPIFHGGQAQRLGKRLRLSVDITDKVLMKCNSTARSRVIDIELTWLHAPLEDQSVELLNLVADGMVSPLLCHLIGLPLVQVTLDRAYSVTDLRNTFNLDNSEAHKNFINGPSLDPVEFSPLTTYLDDSGPLEHHGVFGVYDNCLPVSYSLPADNTKHELKSRFQKTSSESDLYVGDGDVEVADYIPVCLLCPLTRTRIDLPVRSFNCSHLQCFDLHSYLAINMRRPRWSCPICSISAPFRDLRVDDIISSF